MAVGTTTPALSPETASSSLVAATTTITSIVPKPVSVITGHGTFQLTRKSRVLATSAAARSIAKDLAADLAPATGYALTVGSGRARAGDIQLAIGNPGTLTNDTYHEGYQLNATSNVVTLVAPTAAGLFGGVQTIRQLLPDWITSAAVQPGPWRIPAVSITDYPRYSYRGVMVDIARHYEPPAAVERLIDTAASYKMNTLHLHLSDDQGFRVVIKGFPNLTAIGGQGSVGTGGNTMDPGGFWTQAQYRAVVAYAAAHFMSVVPEVDSPSHNNAIVMSEYGDTGNKLLDGHPQDISCGFVTPPVWDYTGDVGYSGMCPDSANTWTIYSAITQQLAAMSSSKYYDLGGDEAHPFTAQQYSEFINKETGVVTDNGKTPMGWADGFATTTGTTPPAGSIAESWEPGASDGAAAVQKGMQVVMAPADHAYLDQAYPDDAASGLGLGWACGGCDLDANYNWDPGTFPGVPDSSVLGVEGALFGETIPTLADAEYLLLPRLMAIAELGWSPKAARTGTSSPAFQDFASRVAGQGARLQAGGLNFYTTAQVPWRLAGIGADATLTASGSVNGTLAQLSAPGFTPSNLTASVNWGDGSKSSAAAISGTAPKPGLVNRLYAITAEHTYHRNRNRSHTATITVTASTGQTATFSVRI
ncbi:MAG: beta-N-acetylhexosaminidase [Sciscionella sp.]